MLSSSLDEVSDELGRVLFSSLDDVSDELGAWLDEELDGVTSDEITDELGAWLDEELEELSEEAGSPQEAKAAMASDSAAREKAIFFMGNTSHFSGGYIGKPSSRLSTL